MDVFTPLKVGQGTPTDTGMESFAHEIVSLAIMNECTPCQGSGRSVIWSESEFMGGLSPAS